MPKHLPSPPIEIKISTVVAVSAILRHADPAALEAAMRDITGGAPDYFEGELAVLDIGCADLADQALDWPALIACFKSYRLNLVAVRHAPAAMEPAILAHGLSLDAVRAPVRADTPAPAAAPAVTGAMIIDTPVRGGQRIYARGSDLIVTAAVNAGAEVIADGSIHVYAPLRGRALAGAAGNTDARIFALDMAPELVSIAGIYRTFEGGMPGAQSKRAAQIRLAGDKLDIRLVDPTTK